VLLVGEPFRPLTPYLLARPEAARHRLVHDRNGGASAKTSTIYAIIGFVEKTEVSGYCEQ
jgi:hypothetical protein